jgi:hypothetical protein
MSSRMAWAASALAAVTVVAVLNAHRVSHDTAVPEVLPPPPTVTPLPIHAANCGQWPGMSIEQEASAPMHSANHPWRSVLSFRCIDINGLRRPSLVLIADHDGQAGPAVFVSVLVSEQENLHTDRITVSGNKIAVLATYWGANGTVRDPASEKLGSVVERSFTVTDKQPVGQGQTRIVARACSQPDLKVSLGRGPGEPGGSWLILFRNTSSVACAIEGYPTVQPQDGTALVSKAYDTLSGRLGGLQNGTVPPLVMLPPGQVASALLEPSSDGTNPPPGTCPIDRLVIGLNTTGPLLTALKQLPWCSPEIHPVVSGATGRQS